jgi:hypothetical protein
MSEEVDIKALRDLIDKSIKVIETRIPIMTKLDKSIRNEMNILLSSIKKNIEILMINKRNPDIVNEMVVLINNACNNIYAHVSVLDSKRAEKVGKAAEKIKKDATAISAEIGYRLAG